MYRILKLNNGEHIKIVDENNNGLLIENKNNILNSSETTIYSNSVETNIKKISLDEMLIFALTHLLYGMNSENKKVNDLVDKVCKNEFDYIYGPNKGDMITTEFQIITIYEKNKK